MRTAELGESATIVEITTAAAQNSIARKSNPLPRKTVANRRSSSGPRRSRITPTNQRKATPAKGMRLIANVIVSVRPLKTSKADEGSAGSESRSKAKVVIRRIENTIPAIAAALGVRRAVFVRFVSVMTKAHCAADDLCRHVNLGIALRPVQSFGVSVRTMELVPSSL